METWTTKEANVPLNDTELRVGVMAPAHQVADWATREGRRAEAQGYYSR